MSAEGATESSNTSHRPMGPAMAAVEDPMTLLNADHPGMILVTTVLTEKNFLTWSTSMVRALEAKNKLAFINGNLPQPSTEPELARWKRADQMVYSWIVNSMSKEIGDTFIYCSSARQLWIELQERFGESNGPQIYQVQREIASVEQGSVVMYFGRLKRLWDELNVLQPIQCTCRTDGALANILAQNKLMQFLMGLNEGFDSVRSQILAMDPLPTVNKAFSMIVRVEKQRSVHTDLISSNSSENNSVMLAKDVQKSNSGKKKKDYSVICEHCKIPGHQKDSCFKILGYPDWYKHLKKEKSSSGGKGGQNSVNLANTPLDGDGDSTTWTPAMVELVQQEIAKALKGKNSQRQQQINFTMSEDFAGNMSYNGVYACSEIDYNIWIIDTGATCHIAANRMLFNDLRLLDTVI